MFSPLAASNEIVEKYKRYLRTIFQIKDTDYQSQFEKELDKADLFAKGPFLDVVDSFVKGKSQRQLIEEGILPRGFSKLGFPMERTLYFHQEEAIRRCLSGKNLVVSTGTGSGKTEAFLFPILADLVKEDEEGTLCPGVRALIIYPMNALANDQIERLRGILENYPQITYGSYTGQTKRRKNDALREYAILNNGGVPKKNELISREEMICTPPNILITNYAMLEYLMIRPSENVFFEGTYADNWKYIVMDEAHVYHGSTGIEVSMLLRRLRATLRKDDLRYILTSATLGDENENDEVARFAENLCASPFQAQNVVRATRMRFEDAGITTLHHEMHEWHDLAAAISNENDSLIEQAIKSLGGEVSGDLRASVYDLVFQDEYYWCLRKILLPKPQTVQSIAVQLGCGEEDLADFITVASYAVKADTRLLDAKYHMFIRACDSAFITIGKYKSLSLTRKNQVSFNGEEYACFEIAVCNACHAIYLVGKTSPTGYLHQASVADDPSLKEVFYLGETISDEDEDFSMDKEAMQAIRYKICPHCGKLMRVSSTGGITDECEHNSYEYVTIFKIIQQGDVLRKCVACENVNNTGNGILRSFFAGQEAVTSVIGTALFEELPSYRVIKETRHAEADNEFAFDDEDEQEKTSVEKVAKQFIAFSDSRQAAAFYASYLNQTYIAILYKRILVETLRARQFHGNLNLFAKEVEAQFEQYHIVQDTSTTSEKEAWKAILAEMVDCSSGNSLCSLGLLTLSVEPNLIPGMSSLSLSSDEMSDIVNVLLSTMYLDAAIKYPIPMTLSDKEFFSHNGHEGRFTLSDNSNGKTAFCPARANGLNKRLEYLEKVLQAKGADKDRQYVNRFLANIWNGVLLKKEILTNEGTEYKVNTQKICITTYRKYYKCPACNRVTPYNVANVCPTFKCSGKLNPIDISASLCGNHYYRMYQDMEIRGLRAVEHTAQLDREKAYRYQNQFKNKEVDVLSCSTTFEMGVDVGSLETVFMRNMPPSPANYAQRAGRAGRSAKSVAYALTFCNKGNHDFTYFKTPEAMIRGKIKPPIFNVENDKIAIRHIVASAFGLFWRKYPEYFYTVETLMEEKSGRSGYDAMVEFLSQKPENLRAFIKEFLPNALSERFDVDRFGWIEKFVGEDGSFTRAKAGYEYEIEILNKSIEEILAGGKGSYDYLQKRLNNYRSEQGISFLSKKNVLPKYGFPVDTVELSVYDGKQGGLLNLDLSRDLSMAISEYAPGSQVVADGNLITSQYIKTMPGKDWKRYDYAYCTCRTLNVEPHTESEALKRLKKCKVCGRDIECEGSFIVPDFGFAAGKIEKATLIKPKKTHNGEVAYVGYNNEVKYTPFTKGNRKYEIAFSQSDEMAVINRSNFYVCNSCGYTELQPNTFRWSVESEHIRSGGSVCKNKRLYRTAIGYRFETDVIQVRFCWPQINRSEQALSLLYGIMKGASYCLDIEESDISGTIQYFYNDLTHSGSYSLVLYDKTPGGAGHVKSLYEEAAFENVLKTTLQLMEACDCGGEKRDTSCYNCLRSYANQRYHNYLQRNYVIDFLSDFFDEDLSEPLVYDEQEDEIPDNIEDAFRKLLHKAGPTIYEGKRFVGMIKEQLSAFSIQADYLIAAYNAEIADAIWNSNELGKDFLAAFANRVRIQSGINKANAEWAVRIWANCLGKEMLNKSVADTL